MGEELKSKLKFPIIVFIIMGIVIVGWAIYNFGIKNIPKKSLEFDFTGEQEQNQLEQENKANLSQEKETLSEESLSNLLNETTDTATDLGNLDNQATSTTETSLTKVVIKETELGWLNVRSGPGTSNEIVAKIYPGEKYTLLEEKDKWYKIELPDSKVGWVLASYATKE